MKICCPVPGPLPSPSLENMLTEKRNNTKFLPHQHKVVSGFTRHTHLSRPHHRRSWTCNVNGHRLGCRHTERNNWKLICNIKIYLPRQKSRQSTASCSCPLSAQHFKFTVMQFTSFLELSFADDICIIKLSTDMYAVSVWMFFHYIAQSAEKAALRLRSQMENEIKYSLNQFELFVT